MKEHCDEAPKEIPKKKNEKNNKIIDECFEESILEKARAFKMTAQQVKSVLYNIYSDKKFLNYAFKSIKRKKSVKKDGNEVRITRSKLPGYSLSSPKKLDVYNIGDYDEERDPDYVPCELDNLKVSTFSFDNINENDCVDEVLDEEGLERDSDQSLDEIEDNDIIDIGISRRTRSQLPLSEVTLQELEAKLNQNLELLGEDFDKHSVQDKEDVEWLNWLNELYNLEATKVEDPQVEELDDDFQYTYEQEKAADEDFEEYRNDKAVLVSNKEVQTLLDTLEEAEIDICIRKHRQNIAPLSLANMDKSVFISEKDEETIIAQLQQHVHFLTQFYMLGSFYKEHIQVANNAKFLLDEICFFTPQKFEIWDGKVVEKIVSCDKTVDLKPLRIFSQSRIFEALDVIKKWNSMMEEPVTPVLFGLSPTNTVYSPEDINVASILDIDDWSSFKFPPLTVKMMALIMMDPFFIAYPQILPDRGMRISQSTLAKYTQCNDPFAYCSTDNMDTKRFSENFKTRFTYTETQLLVLGYFQFGNQWSKIHENMLPTRIPSRLKAKFRVTISSPKHLTFELKLMLAHGSLSDDTFAYPGVMLASQSPTRNQLLRQDLVSQNIPSWVKTVKESHWWKKTVINYNPIVPEALQHQIIMEAKEAASSSGFILIPHKCLLSRTSDFDPKIIFDSTYNIDQDHIFPNNNFPMINTNKQNSASEIYSNVDRLITSHNCVRVKTDCLNLSAYFGSIILDIFKDEMSSSFNYRNLLGILHEKQLKNPSEMLNELISHAKNYPSLLQFITYIFGIKDKYNQYRSWMELVQIAKNLQELEGFLGFDSVEHRRMLLFLSQLSSPKFITIDMLDLVNNFPINLKIFKRYKFTHNSTIPSVFNMIQDYEEPIYADIHYETIPLYSVQDTFPQYTDLFLHSRSDSITDFKIDPSTSPALQKPMVWTNEEDLKISQIGDSLRQKDEYLNRLTFELNKSVEQIIQRYTHLKSCKVQP